MTPMDPAKPKSNQRTHPHWGIRFGLLKCGTTLIGLVACQSCKDRLSNSQLASKPIAFSSSNPKDDSQSAGSQDPAIPPEQSNPRNRTKEPLAKFINQDRGNETPTADFRQVAEQLKPSVVSVISTLTPSSHQSKKNHVRRGIGSGLIVSSDGLVLTNDHVIASANRVDVELWNLERVQAKVLVADPLVDLALLHIEPTPTTLSPIQWREAPADVGMWVISVGHPFGLGFTITAGIISGTGRDFRDLQNPDGLASRGYWSFLQTDASINLGNSGGPLVDLHGRVVGVTTAVRQDGQGIAFAIPAPMATRFMQEVQQYGRLRHPWLGIHVDEVGPGVYSRRFSCVRVTKVAPKGPAAKAGLRPKDLILAVDNRPLARASQLAYYSQLAGVGSHLDLTIRRQVDPLSSEVDQYPEQNSDLNSKNNAQTALARSSDSHLSLRNEEEIRLSIVIGSDK